ncbi:MAG: SPOR domain-containing protein [Prolixibacteraceae bacterium]|jgi:cell division protein FtsN|nr:SPOR domain-containing protein [Prolixibacteraceae bacterium]
MKKTILSVFVLAALFSSCKIFEKSGKNKVAEAPQTETAAPPKVFSAENTVPAVRENPTSDQMYVQPESKPISMRKENFTFSQQTDQTSYGNKNFFVIVGSFSNYDNANRLKADLQSKGFNPIVLKSETGYYRVCINSYTDEADARAKVHEIRQKYSNFSDCWLLIKN